MKKIGIIFAAYNCAETFNEFISPWNKFPFCKSICSIPFKNFPLKDNKETLEKIKKHFHENQIFTSDEPLLEAEARDKCLQYLLSNDELEFVWIVDSDEYYTEEEILRICDFIYRNRTAEWFSLNFKNYVFDGTVWIDGFCPPRIFRVKTLDGLAKINKFYFDNDINYKTFFTNQILDYKTLPSINTPKKIAHIKHMTWLHSNGQEKVEYQNKHFGGICSYKWNKKKKKLQFNNEYFRKYNKEKPELNKG